MNDDHERGMPDPGLLRLAEALGRYQAIRDRQPGGGDREPRGGPGRASSKQRRQEWKTCGAPGDR
ncbi:hypothetical protein [Methylobacterium sp. Leaf102]|uniref:hypothetical protein n=1 Tax=Methylobacterium sp. Leaf102 TaxID=1736253 RepID=UPI001AEBADC0|nr:hypothetical protein [Methylobacterium sp. Leaf102]